MSTKTREEQSRDANQRPESEREMQSRAMNTRAFQEKAEPVNVFMAAEAKGGNAMFNLPNIDGYRLIWKRVSLLGQTDAANLVNIENDLFQMTPVTKSEVPSLAIAAQKKSFAGGEVDAIVYRDMMLFKYPADLYEQYRAYRRKKAREAYGAMARGARAQMNKAGNDARLGFDAGSSALNIEFGD